MSLSRILFLPVMAFAVSSSPSATVTIDFSTLPGNNADSFSTYTQNGFTVSSTAGAWQVAKMFGKPVPDVFCFNCNPGTLEITGGLFNFDSVDIGNATPCCFGIMIAGLRSHVQVLTQTATAPGAGMFMTVNSANTGQVLDQLFISIHTVGFDGNIDNIVLSTQAAVPEPSSLLLLVTVLLGAAVVLKRKHRS